MTRLAFRNLVDFVPGQPRYETRLEVDFKAQDGEVTMHLTLDRLRSPGWTSRQTAGREQQPDKLHGLFQSRNDTSVRTNS